MPCSPRKARVLLKEGKAKVINREPFTLQLLYGSSGYKQEVSLGIDAGTKHIGVSATTEKKTLFEAEVHQRTDIQDLLATRRQNRRDRRNRKARYRKARFQNRKKPKGWLAPSVQHKIEVHLKVIEKIQKLLPISKITIEVAQFDIQKIKNPEIAGKEYQEGPQLGFWNTREYVLFRDRHSCQWCKEKSKDPILNVHHIESRKTEGDSPDNLMTLCKTCHTLIHETHQEGKITRKTNSFRDPTQMGIIRWRIYERVKKIFPAVKLTYGYMTKHTRIENKLEKSHCVDARCISGNPLAETDDVWYVLKCVRRNNRQIHKKKILKGGRRKKNIGPKYVKGFRLFDCVAFEKKLCFIFGRRSTGYFDVRSLEGTSIHASASHKKLQLVKRSSSVLIERKERLFPPRPEGTRFPEAKES